MSREIPKQVIVVNQSQNVDGGCLGRMGCGTLLMLLFLLYLVDSCSAHL